jgi:hypothetical protein
MRSSSLKLPRLAPFLMIVVLGCTSPDGTWTTMRAVDDGGFEFLFPHQGGEQNGMIKLNGADVPTHINIVADSGITYVASWFELPDGFKALAEQARADTVWELMNAANNAVAVEGPMPLGNGISEQRSGWFLHPDGTRIGVVMTFKGERVVILNTGVPDAFFGDREQRNTVRFLNSLRFSAN